MADEQFKRNIAYKLRIGDLAEGKVVMNGEKFGFLDLNGKKIIRVNVAGSIVDKYANDGDKKFLFFTFDDGSGQIKLKTFGDDVEKFKDILQGQIFIVIGVLRFFNNEVYISPEIIKEQDPKYLLLRKFEIERAKKSSPSVKKESAAGIREQIMDVIKNAESEGGVNLEKIGTILNISQDSANKEIQKLLEEGMVFEPRPGKIRWLG